MRIKRDYSHLSIKEQIKKLNFKIKFLFIFSFAWSAFVLLTSILIWVFTSEWELAVAFLVTIPISIFFGGYIQIKEHKKEIKKLQERENKDQ